MAEIIDLGTAEAPGKFACAAVDPGVTRVVSVPLRVAPDEVADEACENVRHLIGKRDHAS